MVLPDSQEDSKARWRGHDSPQGADHDPIKSHLSASDLSIATRRRRTDARAFSCAWLLARGTASTGGGLLSFSTPGAHSHQAYNEGGPDRLGDQRATMERTENPDAEACGAAGALKSPPTTAVSGRGRRSHAGSPTSMAEVGARQRGGWLWRSVVDPAPRPRHPDAASEQDRSRLKKTAARRRR